MPDVETTEPTVEALQRIQDLVAQGVTEVHAQVTLSQLGNSLQEHANQTFTELVSFASSTATHAEQQTGMALERTALTREQTRLSTRSNELANIRTELGRERTALANQCTDLAVARTTMARERTSLSSTRTELARGRNDLAEQRNQLSTRRTTLAQERSALAANRTLRARTRTRLSLQRTELARGRTHLAFLRTGLALVTLAVGLFRYFGLSWWSLFDAGLAVVGLTSIALGVIGYLRADRRARAIDKWLASDDGFGDLPA